MTLPDDLDPTPRLAQTRQELRRARLRAVGALDEAQQRAQRTLETFESLRDAPERRWLLQGRRHLLVPLRAIAHPTRALRGIVERVAIALHLHRLGPLVEHAWYSTVPLRGFAPVSQTSDQPKIGDALRWMGPVDVHGVIRQALFAHPTSTISWRVPVARASQVVVSCALVPAVARLNTHGVIFRITVCPPGAATPLVAERLVHPSQQAADRYWRSLTVDIPSAGDGDTEISITTTLPEHGAPDYAWAMLGEPRLLWRRRVADVARMARTVVRRDGLRGLFSRARQVGTTDPNADYRRWLATHTPTPETLTRLRAEGEGFTRQPTFSVIVPVYNTEPRWLRACVDSVLAQVYPHWQLCLIDDASTSAETVATLEDYASRDPRIVVIRQKENGHISRASNAGLDVATGEFVALLDHDDTLAPEALVEMARAINATPDADFLYSDEDKLDEAGGRCEPYFKPDWSPEQFLNFMYTNHLMVLRRSVVEAAGRFRVGYEGSQDFDLALRVITQTSRVVHVPHVLYHWRKIAESTAADAGAKPWALDAARRALKDHIARTEPDSEVQDDYAPGLFRVKRKIKGQPLVSLVITTDDRSRDVNGTMIALLPHLLRSIVQKTSYGNYEIVVVDNGRLSDATRDVLATIPHRRASYSIDGAFNFAHKLNFSMRHAQGEHVVVLNDDIEVIASEWLSAMLEYSQDPAIGAVGARLLYPDGRLQHIGVVMGVCGVAAHAFHQAPGNSPGYAGSALGPRNYSVVTGACMMTRKEIFDRLGGFNEHLAIDFNDVDYCLRVRQAGYRVVYTPYAELYHLESGSITDRVWNPAETQYMKDTWADIIARDPYYNPNLTRAFPDYRLPE
jgi:GT2 family glycosyltransferase